MNPGDERGRPGQEAASTTLADSGSPTMVPKPAVVVTSAAPDVWVDEALDALHVFAATGEVFSVDVLRGVVRDPRHPSAWGALMCLAARAGWVRRVGWASSPAPSRHGDAVSLWRDARYRGGAA